MKRAQDEQILIAAVDVRCLPAGGQFQEFIVPRITTGLYLPGDHNVPLVLPFARALPGTEFSSKAALTSTFVSKTYRRSLIFQQFGQHVFGKSAFARFAGHVSDHFVERFTRRCIPEPEANQQIDLATLLLRGRPIPLRNIRRNTNGDFFRKRIGRSTALSQA